MKQRHLCHYYTGVSIPTYGVATVIDTMSVNRCAMYQRHCIRKIYIYIYLYIYIYKGNNVYLYIGNNVYDIQSVCRCAK